MSNSTALAVAPDATEKNIYESLALRGDISMLNPQDKTAYLQKLCESLGLNPLTQPFIPLKLNGKEILYASRGATDQLASIHKLTREIIKTERIEDVFITVCKVSSPDGRFDISTGVVTIGGLKGDALCNAMMKSETKAKRRATLSFCGLGFLDESELETIPQNRIEKLPTKNQLIEAARDETQFITEDEQKMREEIIALSNSIGKNSKQTIEYFDANPSMRENCLRKVQRTAIKHIIASDDWAYSEDGTTEMLAQYGIEGIDAADGKSLEKCIEEFRDLGRL